MQYINTQDKYSYIVCGALKTQQQLVELSCFFVFFWWEIIKEFWGFTSWVCGERECGFMNNVSYNRGDTFVSSKARGVISTGDSGGDALFCCFELIFFYSFSENRPLTVLLL